MHPFIQQLSERGHITPSQATSVLKFMGEHLKSNLPPAVFEQVEPLLSGTPEMVPVPNAPRPTP